jgi:hypothetical protein
VKHDPAPADGLPTTNAKKVEKREHSNDRPEKPKLGIKLESARKIAKRGEISAPGSLCNVSSREPKVDLQGDHAGQQNRKLQQLRGRLLLGLFEIRSLLSLSEVGAEKRRGPAWGEIGTRVVK